MGRLLEAAPSSYRGDSGHVELAPPPLKESHKYPEALPVPRRQPGFCSIQ